MQLPSIQRWLHQRAVCPAVPSHQQQPRLLRPLVERLNIKKGQKTPNVQDPHVPFPSALQPLSKNFDNHKNGTRRKSRKACWKDCLKPMLVPQLILTDPWQVMDSLLLIMNFSFIRQNFHHHSSITSSSLSDDVCTCAQRCLPDPAALLQQLSQMAEAKAGQHDCSCTKDVPVCVAEKPVKPGNQVISAEDEDLS